MPRQDPRKLYTAHAAEFSRPSPSWDSIGAEAQTRWYCVALTAAGLDLERLDPGYRLLADCLVIKGPGGRPTGVASGDLYWQLRLWGRMAAHSPAPPTDVGPEHIACAFAHLARLGIDPLLGALEQVGDRPIASALMHSIGAASVAGGGLGAAIGPYHLDRVGRTLERIAHCYDLLEIDGEPHREGKLLRAAAWHCGAGQRAKGVA